VSCHHVFFMGRAKSKDPKNMTKLDKKTPSKGVSIGFTFRKFFPSHGWFEGKVTKIRMGAKLNRTRRVVYDDGDVEDMSVEEIQKAEFLSRDIPNLTTDVTRTSNRSAPSETNRLITNPIAGIPTNPKSHNLGWAQLWSNQLGVPLNHQCSEQILKAELVYVYHGVNFTPGKLNLFGGATKDLYDRLNLLTSCKNLISLDFDMPDYGELLKKRVGSRSTFEKITVEWCTKVSARLQNIPVLRQEDLGFQSVTIGDSHSIAFSSGDDMVLRYDGKTLHSAIESGLESLLRGVKPVKNLVLCFGSIDIRHHVLRQEKFNMADFIKKYVEQGNSIEEHYGCNVFYCCPVPVEHESRRIPQSGYYKGEPFYGTAEERRKITQAFIYELQRQAANRIIQPPEDWYQMDGKVYAKTYMEYNSSFHISPPFHRRNNWGKPSDNTTTEENTQNDM
jgi:hypothetical protein